jgi:tetratricopeptide (TPR) repeat protein
LHQKGNIHGSKNEHPLAIEAYIETLRIYKQHYGDSHLSVANTLFNLGISLNAKGAPEKGLRCFVKALRISKAKLGDDHLDVADTYEQMATSNKLMQNNREAINFFDKALNIRKILTGGNELKSAAIMHEIGKINIEQSNLGSAESAFKESLRIRTTQLGQDDALVAESMFHLGCLYKSRNDMASALKYHEECLRINKSKSDTELSHMADIFASLGDIHSSLGRTLKSTRCYSEAVKLYRLAQSPQDEKVVSCLARQGHVYAAAMHFAKALSCFSECLDLTRLLPDGSASSMAEDRAFALTRMGEIYSTIGNVTEASSHFALALAAYKHIFGPNHLHVASVLQKMAGHFVKVKEFERGYSCAKEAQAMRENLLGKNDSETADSHYFMGKILFECSRYNESIKYMERARRIHLKKYGKMSSQVANENFLLGTICERKADNSSNSLEKAQSELDAAVEYLQDSLTARRERLDKEDPEIAVTLTRLGHVYYKLSAYDNAVDCFSESLKLREANRDNDPATQLLVADALFDLGTALNKALDTKRSLQLFTDALKEYQMLLDKNHLSIAKCLSCIGGVHEKENELSEAIKYLDRAGRIYEYNFGVGDPNANVIKSSNLDGDYAHQADTFYILGTAHDRMGNGSKSLQLYRRTLKIYKTLFGRDSLQVAKVLNRLANMKGRTGSVEKAMVLFDESLRIRMLHLGNNHEDVAETLFGMVSNVEMRM